MILILIKMFILRQKKTPEKLKKEETVKVMNWAQFAKHLFKKSIICTF